MFKKAIAGVLSAVMCTATLLNDMPVSSKNTAEEGERIPAASQAAQSVTGLKGSNALARYLSKQGAEQAASQPAAQPLKASAAEAVYAVMNLDFDRETGLIQVTSTQSEAAKLLVSFIDEDSPANVYSVEFDAAAGEYVHSTFSADVSQLPASFTVTAILTGRAGLPLCKPFELRTYNRAVQEIKEKDTSDFEQAQIVNLDEDENTNFIVLSEDTVRAETTEESNVLVSADYDQNIYVFDHIDESIRSLEKGQYFYIQPTEDDIISTDIQEIVIDGDTATITGSGEIDDMFDFIKIEIDTAQTVVTDGMPDAAGEAEDTAAETAESSRSYLGVSAQVIDSEDEYNQRLDELQAIDKDSQIPEITVTETIKRSFKKGIFSVTPSLNLKTKIKWNVYKNYDYVNVFFAIEEKASIEITAEASVQSPESLDDLNTTIPSGAAANPEYNDLPDVVKNSEEEDDTPEHLIKIPVTSAGAADICIFVDIGLSISVEGKVGAERSFTKGFMYDSDNGLETIDFDTSPTLTNFTLDGSATLEFRIGAEASVLKGLVVASAAGGVKMTAEVSIYGDDNKTYNETCTNVFKPNPTVTDEVIHADKSCVKIEISFKLYIEVRVSVGFKVKDKKSKLNKLLGKLKYVRTYKYETDEVFGHKLPKWVVFLSFDMPSACRDGGLQIYRVGQDPVTGKDEEIECGHKAYRLSFLIDFVNAPAGTTAELQIDGHTYPIPAVPRSRVTLYAVPGISPYYYYINVNGSRKIEDSVLVEDSYKLVRHTISWPEDGNGDPTVDASSSENGPAITTAPRTTTPPEDPSYDYSALLPPSNHIIKQDKPYDLGENISGIFSNDGTFTVIGYGDMNADASIPFTVRTNIRRIVFNDLDPDEGLYINNIADHLFSGSNNLEVVYMPERITSIGKAAFSGCENLKWLRYNGGSDTTKTFVLPQTLKTIGLEAFYGCSAAEFGDLKIPESVTTIGHSAFVGCEKIRTVTVPGKTETVLGRAVFRDCTGLKEAYLGPQVRCADDDDVYWFHSCTAIEKLTIPAFNMGKKIDIWTLDDLFNGSYIVPDSLTEVTVLSGTVIPEYYFYALPNLKRITYPDNITEIGAHAFQYSSGLSELPLPQTLKTIGVEAFFGCTAAEFGDLKIPESVTTIGHSAFVGCEKIRTVTVPGKTETVLGRAVFRDCTGLKEAYLGPQVRCADDDDAYWFHSCTAIEKLTIPAFNMGKKIDKWTLDDLFNGCYIVPDSLTEVTVLSGTVIPEYYFNALPNLKRITYPDNITEIGAKAFCGCTAAEFGDLTIPESVTTIGDSAFANCEKIKTLTVPGTNATAISRYAFRDCTGLKEAYLGPKVRCADDDDAFWFNNCAAIEKLTIPAFNMGKKIDKWTLDDLFNGSYIVPDSLTEVTVLSGTVIPEYYFNALANLRSVTFSAELETVEINAFNCCRGLEEAYLIGEDSDWDKVVISETGNQPLLDIVRRGRPIVILSDLHDITVEEGQTAELAIYAAGKHELTYRWQYSSDGGSNWSTRAGDYGSKISFTANLDGYMYRCDVMDGYGNVVRSAEAKLTVTKKQTVPAGKQSPHVPGYKPGDANGDNSIDVSDAVLIARFAIGDTSANIKDIGVINGDVNGDGNTDIQDVTTMLMFIARRIKVFPVEEA